MPRVPIRFVASSPAAGRTLPKNHRALARPAGSSTPSYPRLLPGAKLTFTSTVVNDALHGSRH
jgi:hypothetical protein